METKTKLKIVVVGTLVALSSSFWFVQAQDANVDDLATKKSENQKKLDEINRQIQNYTTQIDQTRKQASTLANEISIYDKEILSTELQIQAKQTQIEDTNLQINELEKLIEQKIRDIEENKQVLSTLLIQLNEFDNEYFLKTTLSANNFSEFLDQVQYTQNFQDKIYQLLQKIKELKAKLEEQEADLKIQLKKLQEFKEQMEIAKRDLETSRAQKQTLLSQTKGLEKNYQKLLTQSKNEEEKIEKEISDLDAQIRARLGNKSVPAAKGVLAWPMDGVLTQKYGNTGFKALGYTFHNGLDIAAPAGQGIYAAADGVVEYTDFSDEAYGNWAAIKHDISTKKGSAQIYTLYAHMRTVKVKPGQRVKQGDLVGYEGNTGNTTKKLYGPERGYHIHFGVYDSEGFGVAKGKYGSYQVPYGYTYNPLDFL